MDFLIATHNFKKRDELLRILSPLGINVFLDFEKGLKLREIEETGESFEENALLKARAGSEASGLPCIADDSGLCVDALSGSPGIYSARYCGEGTPYPEKIKYLLRELRGVKKEERTAHFVSVVACVFPDGASLTAKGVCEGFIGFEPKGSGGFGFDPVFRVGDKSFAEFSDKEKDAVSHRGKALKALAEKLKEYMF